MTLGQTLVKLWGGESEKHLFCGIVQAILLRSSRQYLLLSEHLTHSLFLETKTGDMTYIVNYAATVQALTSVFNFYFYKQMWEQTDLISSIWLETLSGVVSTHWTPLMWGQCVDSSR